MSEILKATLDYTGQGLLAGFIVFLRLGAALAVLPAFGEHSVPQRVRLALALGLTIITAPAVASEVAPLMEGARLMTPWLATEPVIGLAIGLVLRLFVLALQMAGAIIAQSTSLAQIFGGAGVEPMPAVGHLLTMGGLALAVTAGLHVKLVSLFLLSYEVLPPGRLPAAEDMLQWGLGHMVRVFALAFTLAAPFVIAALIYNLALGAINRAMPQLMVAFVGAPALTLGGLALMAIALPLGLALWVDQLNAFLVAPFEAVR
ncbi:flagellar biosynthetic protein FliR [Ostreiculturibacter nitratireducens]|uniref:flagellar biosynthetic protein FliR n=1 Tax=Ostreiculturibacter nitratireducens TaxID=3075226 RepID=UPI0031B5C995